MQRPVSHPPRASPGHLESGVAIKDGPVGRAALVAGIVAALVVAGILIWAVLNRPEVTAALHLLVFVA